MTKFRLTIKLIALLLYLGTVGCLPSGSGEQLSEKNKPEHEVIPSHPFGKSNPAPKDTDDVVISIHPKNTSATKNETGDVFSFGVNIIDGTEILDTSMCVNVDQTPSKQSLLCIKLPETPSDNLLWLDQYIKQLLSQGWTFRKQVLIDSQEIKLLEKVLESGCQSEMLVFVVYDGADYEQLFGVANQFQSLNGSYLVFIDDIKHRCSK